MRLHNGARKETSNAILFEEGDDYFLVRALSHCYQAQLSLSRSIPDRALYVRKKLGDSMTSSYPLGDIKFANILKATDVLVLIEKTGYCNLDDSLIIYFCNGGRP